MIVPVLPPLDQGLLATHADAHRMLATALGEASGPARRVFVHLQRRVVIESLGHVLSVHDDADGRELALLPPPRAFLTLAQRRRMDGADAALRYLERRAARPDAGPVDPVLDGSTPLVLHALLEGAAPSDVDTAAGCLRTTPTSWKVGASPYVPPEAARCGELLDAAVDVARRAPAPAVARGSWLTFTVLAIHPFVDGNGRVARALGQLVAAPDLPLRCDCGVGEQWSFHRRAYLDALRRGSQVDAYDPARLDATPFMELTLAASTAGARLGLTRIGAIEDRLDALEQDGLDREEAAVALAVTIDRGAGLDDLASIGWSSAWLTPAVERLVAQGVLWWVPRPSSRRPLGVRTTNWLTASAELAALR